MEITPVDRIGPYIVRPQKDLVATMVQIALLEMMSQVWQQFGDNLRVIAAESTRQSRRRQIRAGEMRSEQRKIEDVKKTQPTLPTTDVLKARALVASAA